MEVKSENRPPPAKLHAQPISAFRPALLQLDELIAKLGHPNYLFRLYVSGTSIRSRRAITNLRRICDQYLPGHYELEVIDIHQQPQQTRAAQIIAIPTLIQEMPLPHRRLIGDLSNTDRVVIGLNLRR
jgi:circadian clock protein KaiB